MYSSIRFSWDHTRENSSPKLARETRLEHSTGPRVIHPLSRMRIARLTKPFTASLVKGKKNKAAPLKWGGLFFDHMKQLSQAGLVNRKIAPSEDDSATQPPPSDSIRAAQPYGKCPIR